MTPNWAEVTGRGRGFCCLVRSIPLAFSIASNQIIVLAFPRHRQPRRGGFVSEARPVIDIQSREMRMTILP